jgi:dTDP-4-amino-4,6-dideoxygalactose transaminase
MSKEDYIVFGRPEISEEEIQAVTAVLKSGWIGTGPKSKEFEKEFAKYIGAAHSISTTSCTSALQIALEAMGIHEGDEVITTAMTFVATINSIIQAGGKPVLVDCDKRTLNIDLNQVEKAITKKTKAIIPVHFAGAPVDMDGLTTIKNKHKVKILQDGAHAIETTWNGKNLAKFPDAICYSFYSTKNITTIEGGMICSDDGDFIEKCRLLSNHGISKDAWKRFSSHGFSHYDLEFPGHKFNFTDVQAALGLCQLKKIDTLYKERSKVWDRYQKAFANLPMTLPAEVANGHKHARHLYIVQVDDRDGWIQKLHEMGIGTGVHYRSIPMMSGYQKAFGWKPADYPNSKQIGDRCLSLPLTPYLKDGDVERIITAVQKLAK